MKFRFHRGGLNESRKTLVSISNFTELTNLISEELFPVELKDLKIRYYSYDKRINKDVFIVSAKDSVVGFIEEGEV